MRNNECIFDASKIKSLFSGCRCFTVIFKAIIYRLSLNSVFFCAASQLGIGILKT